MKLKKLLLVVLSLTAMLCMAFGLSGCGDDHEHSLKLVEEREATCGAAGNIAYYACEGCDKAFSDENGENELAKDSWVIPATGNHTPENAYQKDASGHWHECRVCGTKLETEPHDADPCTICKYSSVGSNTGEDDGSEIDPNHVHNLVRHEKVSATCVPGNSVYYCCEDNADGVKGCGKYFSESKGLNEITEDDWTLPAKDDHNLGDYLTDGTEHWKICSVCNGEFGRAAHVGVYAKNSSTHWTICVNCDHKMTDNIAHFKSADVGYTSDEDGHTYICACGQKMTEAHLKGGNVTQLPNTDQSRASYHAYTCEACNYTGRVEHKLPEGATANQDRLGHTFTCSCGQEVQGYHDIAYVPVGSQGHQLQCKPCGYVSESEIKPHTYSASYGYYVLNDDYHWLKCADGCGYEDVENKVPHTPVMSNGKVSYTKTDEEHSLFCQGGCGRIYASEPHTYNGNDSYDIVGHWGSCKTCALKLERESHDYDANNACTGCVFELKASEDLDIDENGVLRGRGGCLDSIIVIPSNVVEIAQSAFTPDWFNTIGDNRITDLYIPSTVQVVRGAHGAEINQQRQGAFYANKKLKNIIIEGGGTIIESNAIRACDDLEYLEIGDGAVLEANAIFSFTGFGNLDIILHNVASMGNQAIPSLARSVTYKGTVADWAELVKNNPEWNGTTTKWTIQCDDGKADVYGNRV